MDGTVENWNGGALKRGGRSLKRMLNSPTYHISTPGFLISAIVKRLNKDVFILLAVSRIE